jgi:hypothetical protein
MASCVLQNVYKKKLFRVHLHVAQMYKYSKWSYNGALVQVILRAYMFHCLILFNTLLFDYFLFLSLDLLSNVLSGYHFIRSYMIIGVLLMY